MNGCGSRIPRYEVSSNMVPSPLRALRHLELAQALCRAAELRILVLDELACGRRQQAVERVLVDAARERLAPLGFVDDRHRVVAEDRAPQVDPGAMQRAGGGPFVRIRAAEALRIRQQVRREPLALRRNVEEERLHGRVRRMRRNMPEPALRVLAGLDQVVQYGAFASVGHGDLLLRYSVDR